MLEKRKGPEELAGVKYLCCSIIFRAIMDYEIPAQREDCNRFLDSQQFGWMASCLDYEIEELRGLMKKAYEERSHINRRDWVKGRMEY